MSSSHTRKDPKPPPDPEVEGTSATTAQGSRIDPPTITVSSPKSQAPPLPRRSKRKRKVRGQTEPELEDEPEDEPEEGEIEAESGRMPSESSKHHSESSSKKSSSSSKSKSKSDDWTDVTEPEERRRIQNRIAQRKFREKAREQKERAERETRNQEHAGSSYHTPNPDDITFDEDVSGLPWGSLNMRHVVAKGHESASRSGSRRDEPVADDSQHLNPYGGTGGGSGGDYNAYSWDGRDSSGGDEQYYDDSPYYYDFDAAGEPSGSR